MQKFLSFLKSVNIFIGPRCLWGPIYGSGSLKLSLRPFADLTDVTLADEDTNSILTDNAKWAIQGNVAMQVVPSDGQICNQCKCCHLVAKF